MFDIAVDETRRSVTAVLGGAQWDSAMVSRYGEALREAAGRIGDAASFWLIDLSRAPLQARAVAEQMEAALQAVAFSDHSRVRVVWGRILQRLRRERRPMIVEARANILGSLRHGYLGRRGGVSKSPYSTLNVALGSRDDRQAVIENRRIATDAVLPGARLVTAAQVHLSTATVVTSAFEDGRRPEADALVTDRHGLALGIITADCAPILLADAAAGVIGAAHAGWRGAFNGIVEATVATMERLGAHRGRIAAAIGPCIARGSYEVDEEFRNRFVHIDADNRSFFEKGRLGHHQFDLEAYVADCLRRAGVAHVEALGLDTYSDETRFHSYRRAMLRGEPDYGRQLSLVVLD